MLPSDPGKLLHVLCVDCGKLRRIYTTDAWQVKRCLGCQKKLRNQKTAAKNKAKRDAMPKKAKPAAKKAAPKKAPAKKTAPKKATAAKATAAAKKTAEEKKAAAALGV